jgi:hypothetical protein
MASLVFTLPAIAVVATAAVLIGSWWSWGRLGVRVALLAALVALPLYDVNQQAVHRYLPTIDWPASVSAANNIAWVGLVLAGADLVAGLVRSRASRQTYAGEVGRRS